MKPCFGYIRVSTQKQGEGVSLEAQKDAITVFASRNDLTVTQWFEEKETDLPPDGPSFITRVCGSGFHIPRFRFGQARRARSPQIAQASGALLRAFDCRAMSAV